MRARGSINMLALSANDLGRAALIGLPTPQNN